MFQNHRFSQERFHTLDGYIQMYVPTRSLLDMFIGSWKLIRSLFRLVAISPCETRIRGLEPPQSFY